MKKVVRSRGYAHALPLLALCAVVFSGCSSGVARDANTFTPGLPPMNPKRADLVTGDLKMRVPNVQKSEREVGRILQTDGGYIESASSGDLAARYPTMTFTLKIPVIKVASAMESLENLGSPTEKSISVQDVTEPKFGTIDAPVKPLLSTLHLSLEQSVASDVSGDPEWLNEAWDEARTNAIAVYRTLFVGLIWLAAFLPILLPGALLYGTFRRHQKGPRVPA